MSNEELMEKRKYMGLSRETLADYLDVSSKTIQNWENGKSQPAAKYEKHLTLIFKMHLPDEEIDEIPEAISKGMKFSGIALKEYRQRKNMTQRELGQKVGVSEQQIQFWEYESRNPKYENILRMAAALGIKAKRFYL